MQDMVTISPKHPFIQCGSMKALALKGQPSPIRTTVPAIQLILNITLNVATTHV